MKRKTSDDLLGELARLFLEMGYCPDMPEDKLVAMFEHLEAGCHPDMPEDKLVATFEHASGPIDPPVEEKRPRLEFTAPQQWAPASLEDLRKRMAEEVWPPPKGKTEKGG